MAEGTVECLSSQHPDEADGRVFVRDEVAYTYSDVPYDDNAWMLDDASSLGDEEEREEDTDGKTLFGLNQSWPLVSSSSHQSGRWAQRKKLQRQISQESLDESTNLLLDHIVMLDLPACLEEESHLSLAAHAVVEEGGEDACNHGNTDYHEDACAASHSHPFDDRGEDGHASQRNQENDPEPVVLGERRDAEENDDELKVLSSNSESSDAQEQQVNEESRISENMSDGVLASEDAVVSSALYRPASGDVDLDTIQNVSVGSHSQSSEDIADKLASVSLNDKAAPATENMLVDDSKMFFKKVSPSRKKKPPLLRHISQESIEESTNLLLEHVVVMDLHAEHNAEGGTVGKPFLVDVEENPLLEDDTPGRAEEDEERFVYKGEDDSCDDDEQEEDDILRDESDDHRVDSKMTVTFTTTASSDDHQENESKDIELIRIETKDQTVIKPTGDDDKIADDDGDDDNDESCWFNTLPDEIIIHIFKNFTTLELCSSIVLVCKKWHDLALDPSLWQHLDFSSTKNDIPPKVLDSILRRCSLLKSISFRGRNELTIAEIQSVADHCANLQKVDLGFVDNINDVILRTLVGGHSRMISSLNVEGCELITDRLVSRMAELPRLRVLNLSHCTKLTDEAMWEVARTCHHLEEFNIDGIPWISDSAIAILTEERRTTLKRLKLDGAELNDISIKYIVQCPNVEEINISFCEQLTDRTLEILTDWANPRSLRLQKGKEFSEDALSNFFLHPQLSALTYLDMSECSELRDQAVINIASQCHLLRHLAVEWCWFITDVGLEQILENCRYLRHLDLLGLHEILGDCLEDIPTKLPSLEYLDLRQCNRITDAMLVYIVAIKRDLVIVNYYGEDVTYGNIPGTLDL